MSGPRILTYADAIERCKFFMEARGVPAEQTVLRGAIQDAYEEIINSHDWPFLQRNGRAYVYAANGDGTCQYTHSTRILTLSDTTFTESWAPDASIRIGNIVCDIESYTDTTHVVLSRIMNPGENIAAGTSCTIYQRWVRLPLDFVNFSGPIDESRSNFGTKVSLKELLGLDRAGSSSGDMRFYAVAEAPDLYGQKVMYFYPMAGSDKTLDFAYYRRPRQLRYSGYDANDFVGTVVVAAGSPSVAGTTTAFADTHVDSIFRIGADATNRPTGHYGQYPYADQRAVASVADATTLTLDGDVTTSGSGVKYTISDPIDIGLSAHNAFLRCCEKNLAQARNLPKLDEITAVADRALLQAMGACEGVRGEESGVAAAYDYTADMTY